MLIRWVMCAAALAIGPGWAADVPVAGERDARVRYIVYAKDDVTTVNVRRGAATRIVLASDEKITLAATGFAADCSKPDLEWCIRADVGTNQILIKPKDGATENNIELSTDKHRDYSIELRVLPDPPTRGAKVTADSTPVVPMFRVIYTYPAPPAPSITSMLAASIAAPQAVEKPAAIDQRMSVVRPVPRNWAYTLQTSEASEDIVPSLVFDDGRFTFFVFPRNRDIPTVYHIAGDDSEARVNFHMDGQLLVVHRLGRRFVLRLGNAAVGVWNDAYELDSTMATGGAAVDGMVRELRDAREPR